MLKKWDELPAWMKTKEVKEYYNLLQTKKGSLFLKRLFDVIGSIILLVLLAPFFLLIAIMIKTESGGSIFYRQERITQYGKSFQIIKFRTMIENADQIGTLVTLQQDTRITKTGKRIRKYRLDELPQLINVLKGEMSFVGTRPEVKKYVDAYQEEMKATLLLPAGITSLASIRYKDEDKLLAEYKENIDQAYINIVLSSKMKYNLEYLKHFSFLHDIRLCFMTIGAVIKK